MELLNSANTMHNVKTIRSFSGNTKRKPKTSLKSFKSNPSTKKQSKIFNFLSRLVKVTEEDKIEKPKKSRNWKGRKAAERAKREEACQQAKFDSQKSQQRVDSDNFRCVDDSPINIEENSADYFTCLNYLPDIEDYLTSMSCVNFLGELPSIQSLEAQTSEKMQEERELIVEDNELLEKIQKLQKKAGNFKNGFANRLKPLPL